MPGLTPDTPLPTDITLHQRSRVLELRFEDGVQARLPFEFLRVYSPSAEVRGHGVGQEVLQTGKREVAVIGIEPVGNYAVRLTFSDGHESGIYSWDYLHLLARQHEALWAEYLRRLEEAGGSREPGAAPIAGHTHHRGCKH
ncbi:gamma-butyrobetaine hydroxylase-like domain-containing protein [Uliginosibacterium sp. sgz301328]|uniref:gamma-butyrobetaine hydroxylase-like domain-containing protein n=1 Tax=Uliginosibacterium sp. sgz301328 TaxID=3243764 RepID=UPI00359D5FF9